METYRGYDITPEFADPSGWVKGLNKPFEGQYFWFDFNLHTIYAPTYQEVLDQAKSIIDKHLTIDSSTEESIFTEIQGCFTAYRMDEVSVDVNKLKLIIQLLKSK